MMKLPLAKLCYLVYLRGRYTTGPGFGAWRPPSTWGRMDFPGPDNGWGDAADAAYESGGMLLPEVAPDFRGEVRMPVARSRAHGGRGGGGEPRNTSSPGRKSAPSRHRGIKPTVSSEPRPPGYSQAASVASLTTAHPERISHSRSGLGTSFSTTTAGLSQTSHSLSSR